MGSGGTPHYRFGVFELLPGRAELRRAGSRVKLRGRPLDILAALLERPGEIVTREDLRQRLWAADTFVDFDHGLNSSVNRLREALGDAADNPRFIETVPRRGYRFIAPVQTPASDTDTPSPPPDAAPARLGRRRLVLASAFALAAVLLLLSLWAVWPTPTAEVGPLRLAVLPFEDVGEEEGRDFLADGLTDALITELSQVRSLRVISRTSAMAYKGMPTSLAEIARELRVDVAVVGSVLRAGERARINAQLVDTARDRNLWARSYDCDLVEVLDVQRRVAREITASIRVAVSDTERQVLDRSSPISTEAFEAYVRGRRQRERLTGDALVESRDAFIRVVEMAPDFPAGWAALADVYWVMGAPGYETADPRDTMPRAREAALRALELDPMEPLAHATLGNVALDFDWNWGEAEAGLTRALEASPSFSLAHLWYSSYLAAMGRHDEAVEQARRARDLDPLSRRAALTLGIRYYYAGRDAEAEEALTGVLADEPRAFAAGIVLGLLQLRQASSQDAVAELERAVADSGGNPWALGSLGYAYGVLGRRDEARHVLERLEATGRLRRVSPFNFAVVHAGLEDHDEALAALEEAFAQRSGWMAFLQVEPMLDGLRDDPRFEDLLARVGHRG
jgi:TolB-like protein/DNA-binding winged helix-turn-helix (wHTH) protein/tetratricopeptide (TPR) repeat protein